MILYQELAKAGHQKEMDRIIDENAGELQGDFLGFTDTYKHLAQLIPKDWTIVDLGCAYGFQSYYFRKHEKYIGVNLTDKFFRGIANAEFFKMSIKEYLEKGHYPNEKVFAIVNYVPDWEATELVKEHFQDLFIYYPK